MHITRTTFVLVVILRLVCLPAVAFAQTPEPRVHEPPAIDQKLLEGLDPPRREAPLNPDSDSSQTPAGEDVGQPPENPLLAIATQMRAAHELLNQGNTSSSTQRLQQGIADDLAALIAELQKQAEEKAQQQAAASQQNNSSDPSAAEQQANGNASDRANSDAHRVGTPGNSSPPDKFWGRLPEHLRQQLQSAAVEKFLPQYEGLIEAFYLRLAEDENETRP